MLDKQAIFLHNEQAAFLWRCSSAVRALGSYPGCRWFNSSHRYHMARWRSGLTHQPFTLAFRGSNPLRVTNGRRKDVRRPFSPAGVAQW